VYAQNAGSSRYLRPSFLQAMMSIIPLRTQRGGHDICDGGSPFLQREFILDPIPAISILWVIKLAPASTEVFRWLALGAPTDPLDLALVFAMVNKKIQVCSFL
jgi:hypothetical protein